MRRTLWLGALSLALALIMADAGFAQSSSRRRRRRSPPPKVGTIVEDFVLKDIDGKDVRLSDFKGKKIFVLELGACT